MLDINPENDMITYWVHNDKIFTLGSVIEALVEMIEYSYSD